ncbi:hypothetical protein OF83DRAFT_1084990 [Amylostereum chailletii]|nr:hypothetical protein OF83DRAFT_1084990 [Amylostereum chailletii]
MSTDKSGRLRKARDGVEPQSRLLVVVLEEVLLAEVNPQTPNKLHLLGTDEFNLHAREGGIANGLVAGGRARLLGESVGILDISELAHGSLILVERVGDIHFGLGVLNLAILVANTKGSGDIHAVGVVQANGTNFLAAGDSKNRLCAEEKEVKAFQETLRGYSGFGRRESPKRWAFELAGFVVPESMMLTVGRRTISWTIPANTSAEDITVYPLVPLCIGRAITPYHTHTMQLFSFDGNTLGEISALSATRQCQNITQMAGMGTKGAGSRGLTARTDFKGMRPVLSGSPDSVELVIILPSNISQHFYSNTAAMSDSGSNTHSDVSSDTSDENNLTAQLGLMNIPSELRPVQNFTIKQLAMRELWTLCIGLASARIFILQLIRYTICTVGIPWDLETWIVFLDTIVNHCPPIPIVHQDDISLACMSSRIVPAARSNCLDRWIQELAPFEQHVTWWPSFATPFRTVIFNGPTVLPPFCYRTMHMFIWGLFLALWWQLWHRFDSFFVRALYRHYFLQNTNTIGQQPWFWVNYFGNNTVDISGAFLYIATIAEYDLHMLHWESLVQPRLLLTTGYVERLHRNLAVTFNRFYPPSSEHCDHFVSALRFLWSQNMHNIPVQPLIETPVKD